MTARPVESTPEFDAIDWANWVADLDATLLYVVRDERILLIAKKRGLGAGKLNGAGGKVDPGETHLEAAVREFEEELGATPLHPKKLGRVAFAVTSGDSILIHVYRADDLRGTPVETEEAVPVWASVEDMPYDRMWEDDRYWLPLLLARRTFEVRTLFDGDRLLGCEVDADCPL
ncbi:MAG: 8-oxo-dGTP diphosphatase [Gemmatimonadota bacterium]